MSEKGKLVDQRANDRSTGSPNWPYKEYFPNNNEQDIHCNWELNQFGYTFLNYPQGTTVRIPEGLSATQISPQIINENTICQKLIFDPKRAKVETITPLDAEEAKNNRKIMKEKGWTLIDTNIVNDIFVQSINM